jgi:hypothetical protein
MNGSSLLAHGVRATVVVPLGVASGATDGPYRSVFGIIEELDTLI